MSEGKLKQDNILRLGNPHRATSGNLGPNTSKYYFPEHLQRWKRRRLSAGGRKTITKINRDNGKLYKRRMIIEKRLLSSDSSVTKAMSVTAREIVRNKRLKGKRVLQLEDFSGITLQDKSSDLKGNDLLLRLEEEQSGLIRKSESYFLPGEKGDSDHSDNEKDFSKSMFFSKMNNLETFASNNGCQFDEESSKFDGYHDDQGLSSNSDYHPRKTMICKAEHNFRDVPIDFQTPPDHDSIYHKNSKEMNDHEKHDLIYTMLRLKMDTLLAHISKEYEKGKCHNSFI